MDESLLTAGEKEKDVAGGMGGIRSRKRGGSKQSQSSRQRD
jgi:hypothetical protein